jgi:Family of unknown function (DUF5759)
MLKKELKSFRKKDDVPEVFNDLLLRCIDYIKKQNEYGNNTCVYFVPVMVFGHPVYDVSKASLYISSKLHKNELKCHISGKNKLYINWE